MKTYPLRRSDGTLLAFEVTSAWISFYYLFKTLRSVDGVSSVKRQYFNEDRVSFQYHGVACVVNEPYGDNSRYWIRPQDPATTTIDMRPINTAFERHRSPIARAWLACIGQRGDA